jgi:hypothetical protein
MQVQNLQIYSASQADASNNGPWIDISNLVSLSVQANNYVAGKTDIQVSNDPNVMINGAAIGPPASAPTLLQFLSQPGNLSTQPPDPALVTSQLPAQTFYVKVTFITKWGETTPSAESSLAVTASNYLLVAAPVPSAAQAPYVIGWSVYVGLSSGTEVLQNGNLFDPQRLVDGIGTVGGTVNPLGPNSSTHFAISNAIPLQANFSMVNGFRQTQWTVPSVDNSGGANSGVSASDGAGIDTLTGGEQQTVAVFKSGTSWMWTPSCMTWKFLRVVNGTSAPGTTVAYLEGQRG